MKDNVDMYVCSKPLQYFNIRNLPRDETQKNILVIEDKFKDAHAFYENVKMYDKSWNGIHYVNDRSKVFFLCLFTYKVRSLYYYLDFMFRAASFLYVAPYKNLFIYEEGISAYRTDIFKNTANYKRRIRNLFGLSEYAGLHPRVKGIFVYNKERYLKKFSRPADINKAKPLCFCNSFANMINAELDIALKIFNFKPDETFRNVVNKKVLLYITSWPLKPQTLQYLSKIAYDYYIIKPHPHIRAIQLPANLNDDNTIVIDSLILAEFIIKILNDRNNQLSIYHHNSSAVMYINEIENIQSVTNLNTQKIDINEN